MKSILTRFKNQGKVNLESEAPEGVEVLSMESATAAVRSLQSDISIGSSVRKGLNACLDAFRSEPTSYRRSRKNAFELLKGVAQKRYGLEIANQEDAADLTVGDAVAQGEGIAAAVTEKTAVVYPDVVAAVTNYFTALKQDIAAKAKNFGELLQAAVDGTPTVPTGHDAALVKAHLEDEAVELETEASKTLLASMKQFIEQGKLIVFGVEPNVKSVALVTIGHKSPVTALQVKMGIIQATKVALSAADSSKEFGEVISGLTHERLEEAQRSALTTILGQTPDEEHTKVYVHSFDVNPYTELLTEASSALENTLLILENLEAVDAPEENKRLFVDFVLKVLSV